MAKAWQDAGVYIEDGTFIMRNNATVHRNRARDTIFALNILGGRVYVGKNGIFIMQDNASVRRNTAGLYGGGVFVGGTFSMYDNALVYSNRVTGIGRRNPGYMGRQNVGGDGVYVIGTFTINDNASARDSVINNGAYNRQDRAMPQNNY